MNTQAPTCWMCGDPADSREHKFKKTDLTRSSRTWLPDDQPFFASGEGMRRIQGPGSQVVTFGKVLCRSCNTTRTQAFDRAYERFSEWVNQRGATLMAESSIDFAEIYGADQSTQTLNLLKYFAKHLGCRIASEGWAIPQGFVSSLTTADLHPFAVSLSRNPKLRGMPIRGPGVLHNFGTIGSYSPSTGEIHGPYLSGMVVGYLDVIYHYDYPRRYDWEGDLISPTERFVRLGECVPRAPHPIDGRIPGSEVTRRMTIGGREFNIPLPEPEYIRHRHIISLGLPTPEMPPLENLESRLKIAHAILSRFYPDVSIEFLENHLTIPDSDALWQCVLPSAA